MKITEGLWNAKLLQSGSVVYMMSSLMGSIGDNGSGNVYGYRMSKAALNMLTKSLAMNLKEHDVSVIALHHGYVATDMTSQWGGGQSPSEAAEKLVKVIESSSGAGISMTGKFLSYNNGKEETW